MSKKWMTSCGTAAPEWSRRDAWLGALALGGGSLLLSAAGIFVKRSGFTATGEALVALAFPASLMLSMPFTYLKGRSRPMQFLLVGVPLMFLVLIAVLAHLF
jgi:hypothetical protein